MFSKLKAFFCRKSKSSVSSDKVSSKVTALHSESSIPQEYGHQSLENARELSLAFISNLLGVRAVETEESKAQEERYRVALDAELIGLTEKSIPKLSKNSLSLMSDLLNPETPHSKIVSAIHNDPALAGKVLLVVNSPLFVASDIEIENLEHALSMLGHDRLKDVVQSSLVADQFEVDSYHFKVFGKALWEHSLEVASNAKKVAESADGSADLAYFVGLVHDVGKLIIFKKLVELSEAGEGNPHPQVFSHLLNDYSHALTRKACEMWHLPDHWYLPILEFQMAEPGDLKSPTSVALFLGNSFAELHTLFKAGEITEFELVWRLTQIGSSVEEFEGLYPDMIKEAV